MRQDRPLKKFSTDQIAEAIGKAISELTGEPYKAEISSIDYMASNYAEMSDSIEVKMTVSAPSRMDELFGKLQ